jgi:hypothetical protein
MKAARARARGQIQTGVRGGPGDPGLFSFLGKIAKKAVSFIPGVGPIISTALDVIGVGGRPRAPAQVQLPIPTLPPSGVRQFVQPSTALRVGQALVPGGQTGTETVSVACPKGWHANKSGYFLMSGEWVGEGTKCVKNRRKNPMNARALSSAITRVNGGKRFQHTLSEIETGKYTKAGNRKAHTHN